VKGVLRHALAEFVIWLTFAAKIGPSAKVCIDLNLNRLSFLGHYGELHHADVCTEFVKLV
jgi:hypothetical protein